MSHSNNQSGESLSSIIHVLHATNAMLKTQAYEIGILRRNVKDLLKEKEKKSQTCSPSRNESNSFDSRALFNLSNDKNVTTESIGFLAL